MDVTRLARCRAVSAARLSTPAGSVTDDDRRRRQKTTTEASDHNNADPLGGPVRHPAVVVSRIDEHRASSITYDTLTD